jgi:toxin ParE1/3/4
MPRIIRSSIAQQDLIEIWLYIAKENSTQVADAILARLSGALEVLSSAPLIGRRRTDFTGKPRSLAVRPYVIFYEPLPEKDGIMIWRILHGARRLKPLVKPPRTIE